MATSPLNPSIFPNTPTPKDHHRTVNLSIVIAIAAVAVGLIYWWNDSRKVAIPVQEDGTQQIVNALRTSNTFISEVDSQTIVEELRKSQNTVSPQENMEIINQLKTQ